MQNGPWGSSMKISSSIGLKKTLNISHFYRVFYPWHEEISLPETRPIRNI